MKTDRRLAVIDREAPESEHARRVGSARHAGIAMLSLLVLTVGGDVAVRAVERERRTESLPTAAAWPSLAPTIAWHSFAGGSGPDYPSGVAADRDGNVYVVGNCNASWGTPLRALSGGYDAFVAKFATDGSLIWNTFLGGSLSDVGYGIAVDKNGDVYVSGQSYASWGSPVRAFTAGSADAFVAKLHGDGSVVWNTFLGNTSYEYASGIAVDGDGATYVTGLTGGTWGAPLHAYAGGGDAFVAKVAANGALAWNTFIGGTDYDPGFGLALDRNGAVLVTGRSRLAWGTPIRAYSSGWDAFVVRLSSTGVLDWNTFLGTSSDDAGLAIALDGSSNAYVAGSSDLAWGSPLRSYSGGRDGYISKLAESGALIWNTFLGGTDLDEAYGIALDPDGALCVAGSSRGSWESPANPHSGALDMFAARLTTDGGLFWNTFVGGSARESSRGIAIGRDGAMYVTGEVEASWGSPVRAYSGGPDAVVAKLISCSGAPAITAEPADQTIASGQTAALAVSATGDGPLVYQWYIGASGDTTNPIEVATASSYATQPLYSTTDFWTRVQNACGFADSETATVTVTSGGTGPTISRIKSKTAKPGSTATILGTGFSPTTSNNKVFFGTKPAKIAKAKTTSLKVTIPKKARKGTVSVQVEVGGNRSNSFVFLIK